MAEGRIVQEDGEEAGDALSVEQEALLLRQCRLNKVELVEKMLDSGKIRENFVFSNGDTILIVACKCGFRKLVVSPFRCANGKTLACSCTDWFAWPACDDEAECKPGLERPRRQHRVPLGLCYGLQ